MLIFLLRTRLDVAFRDLDAIHEVKLFLKCTAHRGSSFPTTLLTLINVTRLVVSTVGRMLLTLVTAMASLTLACFSPTVYLAQSLVCLSSTEAELYASVEVIKDIIFCRAILAELGFHQRHPTTLYVGNTSLITLAS